MAESVGEDSATIMFVFEDGDKGKGALLKIADLTYRLHSYSVAKRKSVAFQAADLLAYELYKSFMKMFGTPQPQMVEWDDLREPFKRLSELPGSQRWTFTNETHMRKHLGNLGIFFRDGAASR